MLPLLIVLAGAAIFIVFIAGAIPGHVAMIALGILVLAVMTGPFIFRRR